MASSHFPTKCTNTEAMILPRNAHQRPSIWVFFFTGGPGRSADQNARLQRRAGGQRKPHCLCKQGRHWGPFLLVGQRPLPKSQFPDAAGPFQGQQPQACVLPLFCSHLSNLLEVSGEGWFPSTLERRERRAEPSWERATLKGWEAEGGTGSMTPTPRNSVTETPEERQERQPQQVLHWNERWLVSLGFNNDPYR